MLKVLEKRKLSKMTNIQKFHRHALSRKATFSRKKLIWTTLSQRESQSIPPEIVNYSSFQNIDMKYTLKKKKMESSKFFADINFCGWLIFRYFAEINVCEKGKNGEAAKGTVLENFFLWYSYKSLKTGISYNNELIAFNLNLVLCGCKWKRQWNAVQVNVIIISNICTQYMSIVCSPKT